MSYTGILDTSLIANHCRAKFNRFNFHNRRIDRAKVSSQLSAVHRETISVSCSVQHGREYLSCTFGLDTLPHAVLHPLWKHKESHIIKNSTTIEAQLTLQDTRATPATVTRLHCNVCRQVCSSFLLSRVNYYAM